MTGFGFHPDAFADLAGCVRVDQFKIQVPVGMKHIREAMKRYRIRAVPKGLSNR